MYFSTHFTCQGILQRKRKKLIYKMYFTKREVYVLFPGEYKVGRLNSKWPVDEIQLRGERRIGGKLSKESAKATGVEPGSLEGGVRGTWQPVPTMLSKEGN